LDYKDKYDFTFTVGLFEHKSNGRDGDADRTYDSNYVEFEKGLSLSKVRFGFTNKLYVLYNMAGNSAIQEYLGFWKSGLTIDFDLPYLEREQLFVNFIPGKDFSNKNTLEAGAKFRTPFGQSFAPYFMVQYWRGYLPSLLDYNVYTEGVRFGIIIYR
jgi:outer membrane phospholipase A